MNCFNHPHSAAVSSCPDCNKGLCLDCSQRYSLPICRDCNHRRIANDKMDIVKDFAIIFGGGAIITYFMMNASKVDTLQNPVYIGVIMFYTYSGLIAGWRFLNKITPDYFLFLPIIGWLVYFVIKALFSGFIGVFILPYRIFMNIKKWIELNNID